MLGGLTIYPRVANFLQCIRANNYENWLAVDKVIAKIIRLTFFGPPCRPTLKNASDYWTIMGCIGLKPITLTIVRSSHMDNSLLHSPI